MKTEKLREAEARAWRMVLTVRSCASAEEGKEAVKHVKGEDLMGVQVAGRGTRRKKRFSAEALAMKYPTFFLRLLKKAARLEKTKSWLGCAS